MSVGTFKRHFSSIVNMKILVIINNYYNLSGTVPIHTSLGDFDLTSADRTESNKTKGNIPRPTLAHVRDHTNQRKGNIPRPTLAPL